MLLHQKILKHVFRVICSQFHYVRTQRCPVRNAMYLGLPKSIYFIFRWSVIVNNESLWISYIKKTLNVFSWSFAPPFVDNVIFLDMHINIQYLKLYLKLTMGVFIPKIGKFDRQKSFFAYVGQEDDIVLLHFV